MTGSALQAVDIREMCAVELPLAKRHLALLDDESLAARFGVSVTAGFLDEYARRLSEPDSVLLGAFNEGSLLGLAELHFLASDPAAQSPLNEMELTLTVEKASQNSGIGSVLAMRAMRKAASLKVHRVHACFEQRNLRMHRIARRLKMKIYAEHRFVIASITTKIFAASPMVLSS